MDNEAKVVRLPGGSVVATYREIADHFGLSNPEKGRQKATRAGWQAEPRNHPADPVRVRVPQEVWDEASRSRERAARFRARGQARGASLMREGERPQVAHEPSSRPEEILPLLRQLEAAHATLREQLARAEERAKRAEEERDAAQTATAKLRDEREAERVARQRAEGEIDGLKLGLEHMQEALAHARKEATETAARAEQAARAAKDANERLARLYSRGLWARVRNRP
ncbi:MAG TPA: hypothetical protein VFD73_26255 [Gemmatimonadales bacterium]|nr:hypothetical protein [Gemmatimonadales bacterium]